jgi:hypothetical protein
MSSWRQSIVRANEFLATWNPRLALVANAAGYLVGLWCLGAAVGIGIPKPGIYHLFESDPNTVLFFFGAILWLVSKDAFRWNKHLVFVDE